MLRKQFLNATAFVCASFLVSACVHASDSPEKEAEAGMARGQATSMADVPNEIADHIMSFLPPKDIASAEGVCANWNEVLVNKHGLKPALSAYLFEGTVAPKAQKIQDPLVAQALSNRIAEKGFAPLENVYISSNLYPKGTRLFNHTDLESHPDMVSTWYTALFGGAAPQDANVLMLVMATLPRILVEEKTSRGTLEGITSYVRKIGKRAHFTRFTGNEGRESFKSITKRLSALDDHEILDEGIDTFSYLQNLTEAPRTFVVCAHDLQAHKDTLQALLGTRKDHRVILALDDGAYLQGGVLKMSAKDIPGNLHHLILSDPYGKVTKIQHNFMNSCDSLFSFDALGFVKLTTIKESFLANNPNLTSFRARGLDNANKIGSSFMFGCKRLKSFDPRALKRVTNIDERGFLGLTSLPQQLRANIYAFLERVSRDNKA